MSLFDRDFEFTKESNDSVNWDSEYLFEESKKCDDCDDNTPEGEAEPKDEEAAKNDAEKVDEGALNFVAGCPAIESANEENYFLTMEGLAIQMAFDRTDTACTEAWSMAGSDEEKAMVTESFSESVKKYWVRFKAFLGRVKNMIIRTVQRFIGYIKTLVSKLSIKWATRKANLEKATKQAANAKDIKVTVRLELLNRPISAFAVKIFDAYQKEKSELNSLSAKVTANSAEADKKTIGEMKLKDKSEVLKDILGEEKEINLGSSKATPASLIDDLKNAEKAIKEIDGRKKQIMDDINKEENQVKNMKDIDSAIMSVKMACINKRVAIFNRELSLFNQLLVLWLNTRTKALNAFASHTGAAADDKKEATTDSALFFDEMMSIIL